jgi:RNA polymerase sigma factor (sigma-70 family)
VSRPLDEQQWSEWLRAANAGDSAAYRRFLTGVTPHLRAVARRRFGLMGGNADDAEDAVQEVLLAIHLKRGTWDETRPVGPWIAAILRNKMIDVLRRRGRGRATNIPIEDVADLLGAEDAQSALSHVDLARMVAHLKGAQRDIVQSISLEGASIRATAARLSMSEGAIRIALHRAIRKLAALFRSDES